MTPQAFEQARISLFRSYGFEDEVRRLEDRPGQPTYALVKERGTIPTILVHGGLAEASVWALMAAKLDQTVVIVDRPGCGLSGGIDYRGVDYREHAAEWLLGVANALGAPRVNLVGNSMGGFFCMAFATAHPERVERLVLPGAPAGLDRQLPLFLRLWGNSVFGPLIGSMKFKDIETLRSRVFSMLVADAERIPDDVLTIGLQASELPGIGLTSRTMLGAVATLSGWRQELMMRDVMAKLELPTLFLWGEKDQFASPESGRELASRMNAAWIEALPNVGHMPQLEVPELIAARVNEFVAAAARYEGLVA